MKIDKVVIACFKKDIFLLRPCVASVRYWYPEIEIYLLKDTKSGDFSTKEIEEAFNVVCLQHKGKYSGWGFSKFEALFTHLDRFLLLDADTVFLGRVLDELSQFDDDFIVTGVDYKDPSNYVVQRDYAQTEKLKQIDPEYEYPGYGVNSGQIVITTGVILEKDIDAFLQPENGKIKEEYEGLFPHADQGVINYLLAKKKQENYKIRYYPFWIWPGLPQAEQIDLTEIKNKTGIPYVLHWAGIKPLDFRKYLRYDILRFYEDYFYSIVKGGSLKKKLSYFTRMAILKAKLMKYFLFKMKYNQA